MSFFDNFPPPPTPPPSVRAEPQPWDGAPPGWVGGWVPWRVLLAEANEAYAVLREFEAFPTGLQFTMFAMFRDPEVLRPGPGRPMPFFGHQQGPRFGVEFSDGRKAVTGPPHRPDRPGDESQPILRTGGGGSSGSTWRMSFWLWPLPPAGPLTWHATWPDRGVDESSVTVDASELAEAASQARQLWTTDSVSGTSSTTFVVGQAEMKRKTSDS